MGEKVWSMGERVWSFLLLSCVCVCGQQLCQYEEDYQGMLRELEMAAALDPDWTTPREKLGSMWSFLTTLSNHISSKVCVFWRSFFAKLTAALIPV